MYERFTDAARNAIVFANRRAQRYQHEYIGRLHILLGLLAASEAVVQMLNRSGVDHDALKRETEQFLAGSNDLSDYGGAKSAIEVTLHEALIAKHEMVTVGDIFLGLVNSPDSPVTEAFQRLGVDVETLREAASALAPDVAQRPKNEVDKQDPLLRPLAEHLEELSAMQRQFAEVGQDERATELGELVDGINRHIDRMRAFLAKMDDKIRQLS